MNKDEYKYCELALKSKSTDDIAYGISYQFKRPHVSLDLAFVKPIQRTKSREISE